MNPIISQPRPGQPLTSEPLPSGPLSSGPPAPGPAHGGQLAPFPGPVPDPAELIDLRQFFYQCPVGLFEISDDGAVRLLNPAAVRILGPVLGSGDLTQLFPLLRRLSPETVDLISKKPDRMGPLAVGQRILIPSAGPDEQWFELLAVRVAPGRVMIVLLDVSEERRLAQREHEITVELQQAMLGHVDQVPALLVGVTYRAAETGLHAGGDWYDVVALPGGRAGLIVGDVVGHSLAATTAMGQLRSAIRAMASFCAGPVELLERADTIARQIDGAEFASVAFVLLDPRGGMLSYATAGHPPLLVVKPDGSANFLDHARGLPLGVADGPARIACSRAVDPGDLLILYTDGLYERRTEPTDRQLARLRQIAVRLRHLPPAELAEQLTAEMLAGAPPGDDVCVLAARPLA